MKIKELEILRKQFQAGKSSLNEEELNTLLDETTRVICEFDFTKHYSDQILIELSYLFNAIQSGEFAKSLIGLCEAEKFYNFGNS